MCMDAFLKYMSTNKFYMTYVYLDLLPLQGALHGSVKQGVNSPSLRVSKDGTPRKVLLGEYPINHMSSSINWRPIDPVTEAGRLVLAVPQLAALAIIASWCQNWDGKVGRENQEMFEIRLVG